jgi:hypothetical protein
MQILSYRVIALLRFSTPLCTCIANATEKTQRQIH